MIRGVTLKLIIPYDVEDIKGIHEDDLVYIINELMSNAIENACKSTEKEVYMRIESLQDKLKIIIENTIENKVKDNKVAVLNNRYSKAGRGHGLRQIKKMLKDNTYFKVSITDRFIVELIIDRTN